MVSGLSKIETSERRQDSSEIIVEVEQAPRRRGWGSSVSFDLPERPRDRRQDSDERIAKNNNKRRDRDGWRMRSRERERDRDSGFGSDYARRGNRR